MERTVILNTLEIATLLKAIESHLPNIANDFPKTLRVLVVRDKLLTALHGE